MQNNFATLKVGSFLRGGFHWFAWMHMQDVSNQSM